MMEKHIGIRRWKVASAMAIESALCSPQPASLPFRSFPSFAHALSPDAPSRSSGPIVIYALIDLRDQTVRYVGKTTSTARRYRQHLENPNNGNKRLKDWVIELVRSKEPPCMVTLSRCERWEWEGVERAWIAFFRQHGPTYNVHEGGLHPRDLDAPGPSSVRRRRNKPTKPNRTQAAKAAKHAAQAIVSARRTAKHEWNRRERLRLMADPNWLGGSK